MEKIFNWKLYESIIVIVVSILILLLLKKTINDYIFKRKLSEKRLTYAKLINNILKYLVILIDILYILHIYGVNVTSLATGLGIVTVIVSLSLQDALKDIIMGFNLIIDDYFNVGDVVKIDNITGKVLQIGLKTTKIRDINTNNVYIVANRNLSSATIISEWLDIDIPLPYEGTITDMESIIKNIVDNIEKEENIIKVEYKGLNEFGDSAIFYKIRIHSKAEFHPEISRKAKRIIKLELDKNKIDIPYQQIDIHRK